jgi:lauroyl/myristoyl acyltransferase
MPVLRECCRTPWLADGRIEIRVSPGFTVELPNARELRGAEREQARAAKVLEGTQRSIAVLEQTVRDSPDQWLWVHRRWRDEDLVRESGVAMSENATASTKVAGES